MSFSRYVTADLLRTGQDTPSIQRIPLYKDISGAWLHAMESFRFSNIKASLHILLTTSELKGGGSPFIIHLVPSATAQLITSWRTRNVSLFGFHSIVAAYNPKTIKTLSNETYPLQPV